MSFDYGYWINMTDVHLYTEYVLNPVDRFFTTRGELLFGGGLEVNLYQSLKLPGLELPAGYSGEHFGFRDHTLNYSTIRFKFGTHLYF